jgi:hypothetical protein
MVARRALLQYCWHVDGVGPCAAMYRSFWGMLTQHGMGWSVLVYLVHSREGNDGLVQAYYGRMRLQCMLCSLRMNRLQCMRASVS